MSGTAGRPEPRCYAVEQLRETQKRLLDLSQSMIIWRARVDWTALGGSAALEMSHPLYGEKYRNTDLAAAKETFDVLLSVRRELVETLGEIRLLLMEAEEYQTAASAGKLRDGPAGYNLMSSNYGPVYDTLRRTRTTSP